jgi:hypothetical protein
VLPIVIASLALLGFAELLGLGDVVGLGELLGLGVVGVGEVLGDVLGDVLGAGVVGVVDGVGVDGSLVGDGGMLGSVAVASGCGIGWTATWSTGVPPTHDVRASIPAMAQPTRAPRRIIRSPFFELCPMDAKRRRFVSASR